MRTRKTTSNGRGRGWASFAIGLGFFAVMTFIVLWPAMTDISNTVMDAHQPNDATSGGIWLAWQFAHRSLGAASTPAIGYPFGGTFWTPVFLSGLAWVTPLWLLAHVTSPIAAWNLTVYLGLLADGMVMFGLALWLTGRRWIALVAGMLFAYAPFAVSQAQIHIGYAYDWIYPLIIWAGLFWIAAPSRRRALLFGAAVGISAYVDGYYVVFAPLVAGFLVVAAVCLAPLVPRSRLALIRGLGYGCAAGIVCALPLAVVFTTQHSRVSGLFVADRTKNAAAQNSATIGEYFVPFRTSPPWRWVLTHLFGNTVSLPDVTGPCVYLGLSGIMLALGSLIWAWRRQTDQESLRFPPRFLLMFGALAATLTVLASLATIGPVPGFPQWLWSVEPIWRAFARLGEGAVAFTVVCVAVSLVLLSRARLRWLAAVAAMVVIADATWIIPWSSWSYAANTPSAFTWLARHPDGAVAAYPMAPSPLPAFEYFVAFQVVDRHPLFNGAPAGSVHASLERGVAGLFDPQTVPVLRREGVRYVLVDPSLYIGVHQWPVRIRGLKPIVNGPDLWLYRISSRRVADAAIAIGNGFNVERQFLPRLDRWMEGRRATLTILRFAGTSALRISFQAESYKVPPAGRVLIVTQDGRRLWAGRARTTGTHVTFTTRSDKPLVLSVNPGGTSLRGWTTTRSVDITDLSITSEHSKKSR